MSNIIHCEELFRLKRSENAVVRCVSNGTYTKPNRGRKIPIKNRNNSRFCRSLEVNNITKDIEEIKDESREFKAFVDRFCELHNIPEEERDEWGF